MSCMPDNWLIHGNTDEQCRYLERERKRLQIIIDLEKAIEQVYQLDITSPRGKKDPLTHLVEATNTVRSSFLRTQHPAQEVNE